MTARDLLDILSVMSEVELLRNVCLDTEEEVFNLEYRDSTTYGFMLVADGLRVCSEECPAYVDYSDELDDDQLPASKEDEA